MLKLPATFDGFSSRADGSFGLRFTSQEAGLEELAQLSSHVRGFGWLLFSENDLSADDIPDEEAERDDLSPSKRLYNVLYAYHAQQVEAGKTDEPFRIWRERVMEKLISAYKEKLI